MAELLDQHLLCLCVSFSSEARSPAEEICCFLFSSPFFLSSFLRGLWVLENIAIHLFFIVSLLFIGLLLPACRGGDEDTSGPPFCFSLFFSNFLFPFISSSHFPLLISLLLSPCVLPSLSFCPSVIPL